MKTIVKSITVLLLGGALSCTTSDPNGTKIEPCKMNLDSASVDTASLSSQQHELDAFYTLMAYSVVYKDWQTSSALDSSRGYNIGSVLVDTNHFVVNYARNSVNITRNESQHGEVRLIQSYLDATKQFSLKGYTIYTSLEPCAMCSGMMKLTELHRTVYGQTDPSYGKALERLQLNSASCGTGGYTPYPRPVISDKSPDNISRGIDSAYLANPNPHITKFLATEAARVLFEAAETQFLAATSKDTMIQSRIDSAQSYYRRIR